VGDLPQSRSATNNGPKVEPRHVVRLKIIDAIDANLRLLIKYGCLAVVAYFTYGSITVLAGRQTFAQIGIKVLGDIKIANSIGYVVGGGGIAYGRRQKKLKEDVIQKLAPRIKELETAIDSSRSSSGITERGRTRPEDEL
jgi:hypothetical protein